MPPCMYNEWLPEPLANEVRTVEPRRFDALIQSLATQWHHEKATQKLDNAATATLPFVALIKAMLNAKAEPEIASIQLLAETLLDIITTCHDDLAAQVRWGALLNRILRSHRRKLKLSIPWKPLYNILRRHSMDPSNAFDGIGVAQARARQLMTLIHRARRFFPSGSAAEIWAEFAPTIRDISNPDAFEALGWLAMLMPTQAATKREGDWGVWAKEWMELWGSVTHIHYWQALWMGLFGRLIRHDVHALVDWQEFIPELSNRFLWAFNLPVGTATTNPPFSGSAPSLCSGLFGQYVGSRSGTAAHSLIYLLGRCPEDTPSGADPALRALESTVALLEQYYHPSNGGKWTSGLAVFMREAAAVLCQRLVSERNGKELADREDDEEDEESEEEEDSDDEGGEGGESGDDESAFCEEESEDEDEIASSQQQQQVKARSARRKLKPETVNRVVAALMNLASKGQSSKDGHMKRYSSIVLSQLSYIAPDMVLPFIHRHFVTALETVTAAKQYGNAIQTLSLCVRPMLLAGLSSSSSSSSSAAAANGGIHLTNSNGNGDVEMVESLEDKRAFAAQSIASAMMATLPGIDANDPPKSLAVFRFYCCVLSCVGDLPDSPGTKPGSLPLYTEEWVSELLARIFTVITNLDAPDAAAEHGGHDDATADGATFLLEGNSMFRPLMELLYMRVSPELRYSAIKRTAKFLLENTFTSVSSEAAILCNALAWADPNAAAECLLLPLLEKLERDVAGLASDMANSTARLTRVAENALKWRVSLLSSTSYRLGPALVPYGSRLRAVLATLSGARSQVVQEVVARALASIMQGLCSYYPLEQCKSCTARLQPASLDGGAVAVEAYLETSGRGLGFESASVDGNAGEMSWHIPNDDEIALANELLKDFAETPAKFLLSAAASGQALSKETIRAQLLQFEGSIGGARSCLPDFPGFVRKEENSSEPGTTFVGIAGSLGAKIGSPELRVLVSDALVAATHLIAPNDSETAYMVLRCVDHLICTGAAEHRDASAAAGSWISDEKWMHEPAVAGLLLQKLADVNLIPVSSAAGGGDAMAINSTNGSTNKVGYGSKWKRRRPMWVSQEKVYLNLEWRASQAAYRWFPRAATPAAICSDLPAPYMNIVSRVVFYTTQGMRGVREAAAGMIERILKRYPCLTAVVVAPLLCGMAKIPECLDLDMSITAPDRVEKLREAAVGAAAKVAAATAAGETVEPEQEQAMACGAAALMRGIAIWRYFTRNWPGLEALFLSLMAAAVHTGPEAQANLSIVSFISLLKFMRPPSTPESSAIAGSICEYAAIAALNDSKIATTGGPVLPWKYAVAAQCYPLLILPSLGPESTAQLAKQYLSLLDSEIPISRQVAAGALQVIFLSFWNPEAAKKLSNESPEALVPSESVEAARKAVEEALNSENSEILIGKLMTNFANSHPALAGGSDAQRASLIQQFRDDAIPRTILGTLLRGDWPGGRSTVPAVSNGHFLPIHAHLVQLFCLIAPEKTISAFRSPIEVILAKPQDQDRPSVASAAEALAGIIASGAAFTTISKNSSSTSPWEEWVYPLLVKASSSAPLEIADIWAAVFRFSVNQLTLANRQDLVSTLVDSIIIQQQLSGISSSFASRPNLNNNGSGSSEMQIEEKTTNTPTVGSGTLFKRITYSREVLEELELLSGSTSPPLILKNLLGKLLEELPELIRGHGEMVRRAAAELASEVGLYLLLIPSLSLPGLEADLAALQQQAEEFLQRLVDEFDTATRVLYEHARAMGTAGKASQASLLVPSVSEATADGDILAAANAAMNAVMTRSQSQQDQHEGEAEERMEEEGEEEENEEEEQQHHQQQETMDVEEVLASQSHDSAYQSAVATVAFSVEWIVQMLASNAAAAAPWIVKILPSLLRLQELLPSELQFVALVARKALIAAKYQLFNYTEAEQTLKSLYSAANSELWPERAASLIFAQYFWFRHALLMGPQGTSDILEMVLQRLEDEKLEVRELAASSLSGVVRCLPETEAAALRSRFLARALEVFPGRGRRRRREEQEAASAAVTFSLPQRHGAALALQALVLSSPYDVPLWLPDILMALVRLASEPAPIRTTVTKAMAEFRRTHEESGLVEVKDALSAEQWEAIRDVSTPASYFV